MLLKYSKFASIHWVSLEHSRFCHVSEFMNFISYSNVQEGDKRVLTISQKKFCADGKIDGIFGWLYVCIMWYAQ